MSDNYRSYPSLAMDEVMTVFENTHHHITPINFGKGVSSFNPFEHVATQLNHTELGQYISYGDINGLASLRKAISHYYQTHFDYDLNPERICITDGASGALTIALAMLLNTDGEIILPASRYPAYDVLVQIFAAKCRLVPVKDDYCIDIEQLPRFITSKTQAILINSPSNPHGAVLDESALSAITSLGIPVIFDEVYQSLSLTDDAIPSAIHLSDRHIIISSLSKSLAIAGFRVGYLIVPESQIQLMTNVKAVLNMCTSLPSQLLAAQLVAHWDLLVSKHRAMLQKNWSTFYQIAQALDLKLRTIPKAGFFALIDVTDAPSDSMQMSLELAQHYALGSTPGIDFQAYDNAFLRLNFACHPQRIKIGLARLANYLQCDEHERQSIPQTVFFPTQQAQHKHAMPLLGKTFY